MSKLRDAFPNYSDLPENIRWITDRLEQLQALQQMANTGAVTDRTVVKEFVRDIMQEYTAKFGGNMEEDMVKFAEEYLK